MSRWVRAYRDSPFHATWGELKNTIENIEFTSDSNEAEVLEVARLKKVMTLIDGMLNSIDPEFAAAVTLTAMNQNATQCHAEINAFIGNKNSGHLVNANDQIDAVMNNTRTMLVLPMPDVKKSILEASKTYNDEVLKYITTLSKKTKDLEEVLKNNIDAISKWYTEQDAAHSALTVNINTVKQTIEGQTAEFNSQFQASELARNTKFEKITETLTTKADTEFTKLAERLGIIFNVGKKYEEEIKRVLNVVVNTAQAGSYSAYANEEKKAANFYRYGTMTLMLLGVSIIIAPEVIHMYQKLDTYIFDVQSVFKRVSVSIVMFVPAFYMASESRKHRANEIKNRQRELVLSTIDPYLELMDETRRQELKGDIAKRIFGDIDNTQIDDSDTANLLAQLTNFIKQIKGGK